MHTLHPKSCNRAICIWLRSCCCAVAVVQSEMEAIKRCGWPTVSYTFTEHVITVWHRVTKGPTDKTAAWFIKVNSTINERQWSFCASSTHSRAFGLIISLPAFWGLISLCPCWYKPECSSFIYLDLTLFTQRSSSKSPTCFSSTMLGLCHVVSRFKVNLY